MGRPRYVPGAFGLQGRHGTEGSTDRYGVERRREGRQADRDGGFRKQLSDVEIAAVVTYTRNNWANKEGDVVTPAEVKAQRK